MEIITTSTFEETVLKEDKPLLVYVYTDNCPNCKRMVSIVEATEMSNKDRFLFCKLNAKENLELVKRYKVLVVPTLLFFKHGILVDKKGGLSHGRS